MACVLVFEGIARAQSPANGGLPVLTNLPSIRRLSREEASRGYPVEVRGVVTFFPADNPGMTIIQAGDEAIYIRTPGLEEKLKRGDEVIVTATTLGSFHNMLSGPQFRVVGANLPLPEPLKIEGPLLTNSIMDARWATVRASVEQVKLEGVRWTIWARQEGKTFSIELFQVPGNWPPEMWAGAVIVAKGVATMRSINAIPTGQLRFLCATTEDIRIETPAPTPQPVQIAELAQFAGTDRYIALNGRAFFRQNTTLLRDATGEIVITTPRFVREGDELTVSGFVNSTGAAPALAVSTIQLTERESDGTARAVFTSVSKIRSLSRAEASKAWPVRFRGVVTFYDPIYHELFVHDGDYGIYLSIAKPDSTLKAGMEVEVTGKTGPGFFAPIIDQANARPLGPREMPGAQLISVPELLSGQRDSQQVEITGVVRQVMNTAGPTELTLMTRSGILNARVGGPVEPCRPLLNAVVRLRGVAGAQYSDNGQALGPRIFVPGVEAIAVEEPAPADLFAAKRISLEEFFRFRPDADVTRRALITGTVTWIAPEEGVYLTGEGENIFVAARNSEGVHIGSRVEAAGYPEAGRSRFAPYLDHAAVRAVGEGEAPKPEAVTVDEIRSWHIDGALVAIRARLVQGYWQDGGARSIWKTEGYNPLVFEVIGANKRLEADSLCTLTGIARVEMNDHREPVGFRLNVRGPEDLAVISTPPWWSGARARRGVIILGLLLAVSGGWALLLRQRVQQQTALVRRQLHEQQQLQLRYHDLFQKNPHSMWVFDPKTLRYLDVNETAIQKYGYSREEFLGMTLFDMRTDAEKARLVDSIKKGIALNDQHGSPWVHKKKDGGLLEVEITARGITFDGRTARMVLAHDVTERVRAEKALRETEARFRKVIESNLIGILFFDEKRNLTDANDTYLKMVGLKREALSDGPVPLSQFVAPESLTRTRAAVASLQRGETVAPFEIECLRADRSRLPALAGAVSLGEGAGFVGFVVDISRETALEQQVRLAQKMEAVGLLAGGVAHDFNNLLQVIQGYTLLSLEAAGTNGELREYLQQVQNSSERAAQLTRQLLTFSRQQDLQEADLDLGETMKETLKLVRRIIGEHIQVDFQAAPDLAKVRADKGRIEQVIMNLCVNARDAMPNGGTLSIRIKNVTLTTAELGNNLSATPGNYVCLRVTDTGCGMDAATTARIFEPFFTTKAKDKGTGLGLSVVYGIVEKHKGVIRVQSQVDGGTTFHVYFPAATAGGAAKILSLQTLESADKTGMETILLVEDEPAVRLLASRVLQRAGYDVRTAADGVEACSVFEKSASEIDLILMDVIMPKMGGREAYEHIARKRMDVPVIFCSGYSERELGADFLQHHQLDLLPKPYRPDELLTRVRDRLGAKS